jgi:hypothetical protein
MRAMVQSFKPKILFRDVPDILTKPLDASLPDEDLRAVIASHYEIAMKYFGEPEQYLALHLLGLLFPAFDWPKRRGKGGRPRTPPWKLRRLHRLKKNNELKISNEKSRAEICSRLGLGPKLRDKRTLENLATQGKREEEVFAGKLHDRVFRRNSRRDAILAMTNQRPSFFKLKK